MQSETAATIGTVTIEKIKQETANLTDTNDQIRSIVRNLNVEYYKILEETNNAVESGNAIRATVDKLKAETANLPWQQLQIRAQEMLTMTQAELAKLDLSAAQGMDNIAEKRANCVLLLIFCALLLALGDDYGISECLF